MKKIALLLTAFMALTSINVKGQEDTYLREYLERLENSRKYLLEVAQLMPEEHYHFKASPESLSFAENLLHIGFAMNWHAKSLIGDQPSISWQEDTVFKVADKTKAEMIALIDKYFKSNIAFLAKVDPKDLNQRLNYFGQERSKRQILMLLGDHITHHRGQMLVYLRLKGITPPRYVLYQ